MAVVVSAVVSVPTELGTASVVEGGNSGAVIVDIIDVDSVVGGVDGSVLCVVGTVDGVVSGVGGDSVFATVDDSVDCSGDVSMVEETEVEVDVSVVSSTGIVSDVSVEAVGDVTAVVSSPEHDM